MQSPLIQKPVTEEHRGGDAHFHGVGEADDPVLPDSWFPESLKLIQGVSGVEMIGDVMPLAFSAGLQHADLAYLSFEGCSDCLGVSYSYRIPVGDDVNQSRSGEPLGVLTAPFWLTDACTLEVGGRDQPHADQPFRITFSFHAPDHPAALRTC